MNRQTDGRQKEINQVTILGTIINLLLSIVKGLFGWLTGSVALVADALHSVSDLITDVIVLAGTMLGAKPADKTHPFGHGKLETMSTILIAAVLIIAGILLMLEAVEQLDKPLVYSNAKWIILSIAAFSVLMKEWLFRRTMMIAKKTASTALVANAWHHRSDALSSIAVLLGAVALACGWPYGDQSAGILVGLMVSYAGLKILLKAINELGEASIDQQTKNKIVSILGHLPDVASFHRLRTRRSGHIILMDVHILVEPGLTVIEGHDISKQVEQALAKGLNTPIDITVHIEPDIPSEKSKTLPN